MSEWNESDAPHQSPCARARICCHGDCNQGRDCPEREEADFGAIRPLVWIVLGFIAAVWIGAIGAALTKLMGGEK